MVQMTWALEGVLIIHYSLFMYFTQSTIELGAQEAWPINVLPRWLKVTWYNIE